MELTQKGLLLLGLPYNGKLYYEVEARVLTMGTECEVLESIEALNLNAETPSTKDQVLNDLAYMAKQIRVVGIPENEVTALYLLEHLATDDYTVLNSLIADLRKKRINAGESPNLAESENEPA
ncbi:hypothetical protein [Conservatibacter flavescens]|uniref:Uncharacterized protein n=1 Tax=Conservatibacter flavescens TaxID=28161 RepID=A0A2M8S544_9PAST|nr:hypothetical protein [Conservatibacter flavescens]PJG86218.1 hypothetical protein CVP05_03335 [Conservatibacter flavescens]